MSSFLFAYLLGGVTFLPLLLLTCIAIAFYTSVPIGNADPSKPIKAALDTTNINIIAGDPPKIRSGWLTVRHTYEETSESGSYVNYVVNSYRSIMDARSRDPKRMRPKDQFFCVLKGNVLFLYEDEDQSECYAVLDMRKYDVGVYPEGVMDGELFAKRNAIRLRRNDDDARAWGSVSKDMRMGDSSGTSDYETDKEGRGREDGGSGSGSGKLEKPKVSREESSDAFDSSKPWFIFVRSNSQMEDWYHALIHASSNPSGVPVLQPLVPVFSSFDMSHLVSTLDAQPDPIPMRWFNAMLGRLFFSLYRTDFIEAYIISRLMRKLAKVKRPAFLSEVVVREVSVGTTPPTFSKPMLKELTKEGDASMEVKVAYVGEVRITIETAATLSLGSKFRSYTVKLVLAVVLKELEGNLLLKIKQPPSNRIWYGFTQMPRMELEVQPVVSDRQIKWSMILKPIESRLKEIIQESVVLPNMDDIPFFDTRNGDQRGGIWASSARKEKYVVGLDSGPSVEIGSTADMEGLEGTIDAGPDEPLPFDQKAPGAESSPHLAISGSVAASSSPPDPSPVPRASTVSGATTSSSPAKRASWFRAGGGKSGEVRSSLASGSASVLGVGVHKKGVLDEGKIMEKPDEDASDQQDSMPVPPLAPRASSNPSMQTFKSSSPAPLIDVTPDDESLESPGSAQTITLPSSSSSSSDLLDGGVKTAPGAFPSATTTARPSPPVLPARRSTQRLSRVSSTSSSAFPSPPPWPTSPNHGNARNNDSSSTLTGSTGSGSTTPPTGTLLSTWKARTTDKQAISASVNQAKDAMKKWGVSFAAKRRAQGGVVGSMFGRDGQRSQDDLDSEDDDMGRRPWEDSEPQGSEQQPPRSAVQRKEVNYDELDGGSGVSRPPSTYESEGGRSDTGSGGESSRERSKSRSRASSVSHRRDSHSGSFTGGVQGSHSRASSVRSVALSSSPPTNPTVGPRFVQPSAPRTTTELSTSSRVELNVPTEDDESARIRRLSGGSERGPTASSLAAQTAPMSRAAPAPIHVQPTASGMTMSVPGIHESHKGGIMAMGSAPPPPPPPPPRPPTIQTLYRVFKGSNLDAPSTDFLPNTEGTSPPQDAVLPRPIPAPAPAIPPRPVPPTLPPRRPTAPTAAAPTTSEAGGVSSTSDVAQSSRPTSPTATATLRSVAARHAARTSLDLNSGTGSSSRTSFATPLPPNIPIPTATAVREPYHPPVVEEAEEPQARVESPSPLTSETQNQASHHLMDPSSSAE